MAVSVPSRVAGETAPIGQPRRGLLTRLSGGHLVMIVAGLVGMVLTLALLRNADERVKVAVAATDLRTGSVVGESSVRYERVRMDGDLLETVLRPADVAELERSIATGPIRAGELIARSDLRPVAARSGLRAVSIPIAPSRAVNGELAAGDRVDVVLAAEHEVAIIVAGAEVLDVGEPDRGGAFGRVGDEFTVTLAVDAQEAQLLAAAITDGDILIARSTGAKTAESTPPLPVDFVDRSTTGA
ncbi:MAG: RcpC/CpaB family pilus assembly protein [Acidimicrobiia bacterium]